MISNLHKIGGGSYAIPDNIKGVLLWLYNRREDYKTRYNPFTREIGRQNRGFAAGYSGWEEFYTIRSSDYADYYEDCVRKGWFLRDWKDEYLQAFEIVGTK